MVAVRFAMPEKAYRELQSSYDYLDLLFARSFKAKRNNCLIV